jgi:lipopolysaccharide transport system ATP-binding protein
MSKLVLRAENISKQYRLGQLGTGTISHDLNRAWAKLRGKEDPYLKVGDANDRSLAGGSDYVWSLKDINFEVKQGEVLGIIGKNGAGKSTLLKILSQVTTPTTGKVAVRGRIAALLEVGTGFHPDLSGRENIFLNGAILGMKKFEIKSKLDEIVDFSGVAKYLDTPVKRYSSGMMMRLGFAVAAHLEPEILIVDEVLAVGDAQFQKKCLGKMKSVAVEGRTVLFVSHNMGAVKNLCTQGLLIEKGRIKDLDNINSVISRYLTQENLINSWSHKLADNKKQNGNFLIRSISVKNNSENVISEFNISESVFVDIEYEVFEANSNVGLSLVISDNDGTCLFGSLNNLEPNYYRQKHGLGNYIATCTIPGNLFNNIEILISVIGFGAHWTDSFVIENAVRISGVDDGVLKADYFGEYGGFMRPKLTWHTIKK